MKFFRNPIFLKPFCFLFSIVIILFTSSFTFTPKKIKIPAGTLITLKMLQSVSTEDCSEGDIVSFSIVYDVMADGKKLITAGTKVTGNVLKCEKPKGVGKPGTVEIDISNLKINGNILPLSAAPLKNVGEDRKMLAYAVGGGLCLFVWVIGGLAVFFIKGEDGKIDAGKIIEGNVSTDIELNI